MSPRRAPLLPLLVAAALSACTARPRNGPDAAAAPAGTGPAAGRAEQVLTRLGPEQKVGQLFTSWILARREGQEQARARMLAHVREVSLGGVILSLGPVADAAEFVAELQSAAAIPLLCAGDFEGGVAFRFDGATGMGNQMLVGATGQARLARAMGEVTGREAVALGVPWVFAPVLDVNSNPDNPIINVRSFGEDPELVARLGAAFAAGVQSQGAVACGKHFPGHGDVATDSHLELPTVPGDAERLRAVELLPFRRAAQQGLASVMTGHLAVPGLGEDPAVPATLSPRILGGVLRGELGFDGLIVTDALDMGGVKNRLPPGEVAVRALLAGADVLLMPPDPVAARDAVLAALASGRLPAQRLDDAVLRILRTKERLGLLGDGPHGPAPDWRARVAADASRATGREIAARGVTVVQDPGGHLPLAPDGAPWLAIEIHDRAVADGPADGAADGLGRELGRAGLAAPLPDGAALQGRAPALAIGTDSPPEWIAAVARDVVAAAPRVVLALHVRVRSYSGTIGLPPHAAPIVDALAGCPDAVVVSFGNPYLIRELPAALAARCTYLCAYASSGQTIAAVAGVLAGRQPASGRLPVSIPGAAAAGTGLLVLPGTGISRAEPADEGVDPSLRDRIAALLAGAVRDRVFPGAVCVVARNGRQVLEVAAGRETFAPGSPAVTPATRYDLASLTKVCATTPAVLALVARGSLSLDDPVQRWLPEFAGEGKDAVTVRHLLAHSSGLPAYRRYFEDAARNGRAAFLAAICCEALATPPGERVVYSDLGMILLSAVVERAGGRPFADQVRENVLAPLGMAGAAFAPTDREPLAAAPTEVYADGEARRGHVHDENAFAMGGISGHAGLFGTADDVLRAGLLMMAGGRQVLPRHLVDEALRPQAAAGSGRGLGFDLLQPGNWAGSSPGPGAFGHTGFTGTSLLCDPRSGVCVVLLTNRVHPSREQPARIRAVRAALHDLVLTSVER